MDRAIGVTVYTREYAGVVVTFGPGVAVKDVRPSFSYDLLDRSNEHDLKHDLLPRDAGSVSNLLGGHMATTSTPQDSPSLAAQEDLVDTDLAARASEDWDFDDWFDNDEESLDKLLSCVVCLSEAEDPCITSCGHTYCTGCIQNQCSAISERDIPIRCLGNADTCRGIFDLHGMSLALGTEAFDKLLDATLALHVRANPTRFQYCPTPDCPFIYKVSDDRRIILSCPICGTSICTACRSVYHTRLTCEEYQSTIDEDARALAVWKEKHKVKDCPRCKMAIEKTGGCNHVNCTVCNAHLCWICLRVYENGPDVYSHMLAVHQSYVGEGEQANLEFHMELEMAQMQAQMEVIEREARARRGLALELEEVAGRIEQVDEAGLMDVADPALVHQVRALEDNLEVMNPRMRRLNEVVDHLHRELDRFRDRFLPREP